MVFTLRRGGMAEWFKAAVLKTVVRKYRGFESYSLRQNNTKLPIWRDDREADGARLLSECGGYTPPRVRIPLSPPHINKGWLATQPAFVVFCVRHDKFVP